jgi:hypothetical protein
MPFWNAARGAIRKSRGIAEAVCKLAGKGALIVRTFYAVLGACVLAALLK